jgi:hypothetical protein
MSISQSDSRESNRLTKDGKMVVKIRGEATTVGGGGYEDCKREER